MIKRISTDADLEALIESGCGHAFATEAGVGQFNPDTFRESWSRYLAADLGAIWVFDQDDCIAGTIGGLAYPDLNTGHVHSVEAFWYVLPNYRGSIKAVRLVLELEKWAAAKGSVRHSMIKYESTMDDRIDQFYLRSGYTKAETSYIKNPQLWHSQLSPR